MFLVAGPFGDCVGAMSAIHCQGPVRRGASPRSAMLPAGMSPLEPMRTDGAGLFANLPFILGRV